MDFEEAYCANVYTDGEIEKVFHLHSEVPHKMKVGGQSAKRFARIRDNEIKLWYKKLNQYLMRVEGPIFTAISFVYKPNFVKHLHTYVKEKITRYDRHEYGGLTGIYQYIRLLEDEKGNK